VNQPVANKYEHPSLPLVLAQSAIMAVAVWLFLQPLATGPGLVVALVATVGAYVAAWMATKVELRLLAGLAIAAGMIAIGHLGARVILAQDLSSTTTTIVFGDCVYLGLGCAGVLFAIRILRERVRAFAIFEVAVVIGAVAHTFADHRHQRIHQPRFLSDWAWTNGIDPQTVLGAVGIGAIVVSLFMLLRGQRLTKLLLSVLLLLVVGIVAYVLVADRHIAIKPDTNGLGLTGESSKSNSSSSRKPDPVAIALLHDDLEIELDIMYFRQTVRSRLAGERLVEDNTGKFDQDVLTKYPAGAPVTVAKQTQSMAFHAKVPMSMFLMVSHPQPIGLGHPAKYTPLDNPDPRRFVAAYGVESLVAIAEPGRLLGRLAVPVGWTDEERKHYLEIPDDPRYAALAQQITRELDPRYVNDPVMTAYAIRRYLETEGFYSLQQKELVGTDPVGKFLFGDMKGYCVHFAHAAAYLFRSQGIPARVALGYAVQTRTRGSGSAILIAGNMAHAWPEIYIDGVGWMTFDVYPERSDEPRPPPVDAELEQLLGELARKDKTGGRSANPDAGWYIPWEIIGGSLLAALGAMLVFAYGMKGARRVRGATSMLVYRGFLDRLSDLGLGRQIGESRERHAARVAKVAPSFVALTNAHLKSALGRPPGGDRDEHARLAAAAHAELAQHVTLRKRILGLLHPIGWLFTR
jgi:protein-glutamine gamma-glutamyltransferase